MYCSADDGQEVFVGGQEVFVGGQGTFVISVGN